MDAGSDSESDEPNPLHVVNTTIEMPEGAVMSDNDDKNDLDVNDPHRALDIKLDDDDDFYAPHKAVKPKTLSDPEPPKTKKKREKAPEEKKKKKKTKEEPEVNLFGGDEAVKVKKSKKKSKNGEKPEKNKKSSKKSEYEEAL